MNREGSTEASPPRGIYDCMEAYKTPTGADYRRLFQAATVVLDTNVLINLYRSNKRTRRDTFTVLSKLQSQLWVPHQVISEFWRNRDLPSVAGHHRAKARTACAAIDKTFRSLCDGTDRWLKDVHLDADDAAKQKIKGYRDRIQRSLDEMKHYIEEQAENDALDGTDSTHTDPVLRQLEPLLLGRVGAPLSSEEYSEAVSEAKRRADASIPPGYEDFAEKPDSQAAGDYIIWKQVMTEASRVQRDILLVTGDVKEDWWTLRAGNSPARPRHELRHELREVAGVDLFMMTPSQLLAEASKAFRLQVDERSVSDLASREGGPDLTFPPPLTEAIVRSVKTAHEHAKAVHEVSGLNSRSPYAFVMDETLRGELARNIEALGGESIEVNGSTYPVWRGQVLIPLKVHSSLASTRIMTSKRLQALGNFLNPRQETLDFAPGPRIDLVPLVIGYASSPTNGVQHIEASIGRFDGHNRYDPLLGVRLL